MKYRPASGSASAADIRFTFGRDHVAFVITTAGDDEEEPIEIGRVELSEHEANEVAALLLVFAKEAARR